MQNHTTVAVICAAFALAFAAAAETAAQHAGHGAAAMDFDQARAVHHFLLRPDGGIIQVEAREAADAAVRDSIRQHLQAIARAFAAGDFAAPLATHGEMPPGVEKLKQLRSVVTYTFEELPRGGSVRIVSANDDARNAVHEFLRYQIREHHTGDPSIVGR